MDTGSRIRVYHQLRALAQRHEVTLLTLDPQGWAPPQIEAIAPFCQRVIVIPRDPFQRGRLHTATRFFSIRPIVYIPFPEMVHQVRRLHADRPFDVAIASNALMAPYALEVSGVPHILEEHNSHTRWMHDRFLAQILPLPRLRCWLSWRKSILYESHLFPQFDLVTMASERDASTSRKLIPNGGPPVVLVPNGVDCEQFRSGLAEPQPNTLIFTGALAYYANYEAMQFFLHQIYPRIRSQCLGVSLCITGSTSKVDLDRLPLNNSVTLTGFMDDVRQLIATSWISVVPILSGGGTRIKILEAMALGTPVVATTKGAEGLDVINGEHILLADNPATFAERTLQLLRDPALRQRLTMNARRLVEQRYDWSRISQCFVDLVEGVVEKYVHRGMAT
ncbi:MAG: glycosyltransferase [Anaerolineae bacterium]|nr:glycosyltransferase [Anaerolineae bacterium]